MQAFGEILRRRRRALDVTIAAAARRAGTSKGYICDVESGRTGPPAGKVTRRLAALYGLDPTAMEALAHVQRAKDRRIREVLEQAIADYFPTLAQFAAGAGV